MLRVRKHLVFGEIVIGPPGSGKTTYCHRMRRFCTRKLQRTVYLVNLDPANECFEREPDLNVMELVRLDSVMETHQLGPNGALMFCMEYLEANIDWLFDNLEKNQDKYIIIDMPGQVELYTHQNSARNIFHKLVNSSYSFAIVNLIDSHYCSEPHKFISTLMLSLSTMIHIGLPTLNVFSKGDELVKYADQLDFNIDFYTEVLDLNYLLERLNSDVFGARFKDLNAALIDAIGDFGLVSFSVLNWNEPQLVLKLKNDIDKDSSQHNRSTTDEDHRRRTIIITKQNNTYGFTLQSYAIRYKKDRDIETITYVDFVEFNGPACRAGLREGDVILSINGRDLEKANLNDIVAFIRNCSDNIRMVVLFEDCVRKVDLHIRYVRLQKCLDDKMAEFEKLCLQEKCLLDGKWKTFSLPSRNKEGDNGVGCGGFGSKKTGIDNAVSSEDIEKRCRRDQPQSNIITAPTVLLTYQYFRPPNMNTTRKWPFFKNINNNGKGYFQKKRINNEDQSKLLEMTSSAPTGAGHRHCYDQSNGNFKQHNRRSLNCKETNQIIESFTNQCSLECEESSDASRLQSSQTCDNVMYLNTAYYPRPANRNDKKCRKPKSCDNLTVTSSDPNESGCCGDSCSGAGYGFSFGYSNYWNNKKPGAAAGKKQTKNCSTCNKKITVTIATERGRLNATEKNRKLKSAENLLLDPKECNVSITSRNDYDCGCCYRNRNRICCCYGCCDRTAPTKSTAPV